MARKILLRSRIWQEKSAANCLISRKSRIREPLILKLLKIQNSLKTIKYNSFQPLEKHQKQLKYIL